MTTTSSTIAATAVEERDLLQGLLAHQSGHALWVQHMVDAATDGSPRWISLAVLYAHLIGRISATILGGLASYGIYHATQTV